MKIEAEQIKKWGAILSFLGALGGFVLGIYKVSNYIGNLYDQIVENKEEIIRLQSIIETKSEEFNDRFSDEANQRLVQSQLLDRKIETISQAMREQADQQRELITQLRIAVAELQTARQSNSFREAERSYSRSQEALESVTEIQGNDPLSGLEDL